MAKIILTGLLVFGFMFILYKAFRKAKEDMAEKSVPKRENPLKTLVEEFEQNPKKAEDMTSEELFNLFPTSLDEDIIYNKKKPNDEQKQ